MQHRLLGVETWSSAWLAVPLLIVLAGATTWIVKEPLGPNNVSLDESPVLLCCVMELAVASASGRGRRVWWLIYGQQAFEGSMGCDSVVPESVLGYIPTYGAWPRTAPAEPKQVTYLGSFRRSRYPPT